MLDQNDVLIEDEIQLKNPADVIWNFHTEAKITVEGTRATLMLNGKRIEAVILSPSGAHFDVRPADPPPPQAQQPNTHNLEIVLPKITNTRISVVFRQPGKSKTIHVEPLDQWIAAAHQRN